MSLYPALFELSSLDGTNGFKINGEAVFNRSGRPVASAGDVNGDGFDDLIIGAWVADPDGSAPNDSVGASYVVFGAASGFGATFELSSLDGSNGFKIDAEATYDYGGRMVASAGDVNGDGFADLIIGAIKSGPSGTNSGAAYVVFGKASGFDPTFDRQNSKGRRQRVSGDARDVCKLPCEHRGAPADVVGENPGRYFEHRRGDLGNRKDKHAIGP